MVALHDDPAVGVRTYLIHLERGESKHPPFTHKGLETVLVASGLILVDTGEESPFAAATLSWFAAPSSNAGRTSANDRRSSSGSCRSSGDAAAERFATPDLRRQPVDVYREMTREAQRPAVAWVRGQVRRSSGFQTPFPRKRWAMTQVMPVARFFALVARGPVHPESTVSRKISSHRSNSSGVNGSRSWR